VSRRSSGVRPSRPRDSFPLDSSGCGGRQRPHFLDAAAVLARTTVDTSFAQFLRKLRLHGAAVGLPSGAAPRSTCRPWDHSRLAQPRRSDCEPHEDDDRVRGPQTLSPGNRSHGSCVEVTNDDVLNYEADKSEGDSSVIVTEGEQLCEIDLLNGVLVHSAANYADMLAAMVSPTRRPS